MNEFPPPRQRGLALHAVLTIMLSLVSLFSLWLAFQTPVGLVFTLFVLAFIVTAIPVPILAYRIYALTRANYLMDRNTLRLVWGLRSEDIPVTDVEWVRPLSGLTNPIKLPLFRLPGGILGITRHPDLGRVEFLASESQSMVLVATARQVFAISPESPSAFMSAFQATTEMGSLVTVAGYSEYPSFVVVRAWESTLVRYLWVLGSFLNIGLLAWVAVLMPSLGPVPLGFDLTGAPLQPVPASQLILLPILSAFLFIVGFFSGLFFYRKPEQQVLALAVWASGVLSTLFFLVAVFFLLSAPA